MYNTKNILYLISSLAAIEKITLYTKGLDTATALLAANDQMNFNASNSLLIAIAEEIKKTDPQLLQTKPSIQWQNMADMRNILAHDYRGIDPEVVFDVIKNDLPQLKKALLELLKLLPQNLVQVVLATKQYQHLQQVIIH
jgi:uncharacterized protein with HEPN domain